MQTSKSVEKFSKRDYNPELEEVRKHRKTRGLRGNGKFKTQFLKPNHIDGESYLWGK